MLGIYILYRGTVNIIIYNILLQRDRIAHNIIYRLRGYIGKRGRDEKREFSRMLYYIMPIYMCVCTGYICLKYYIIYIYICTGWPSSSGAAAANRDDLRSAYIHIII